MADTTKTWSIRLRRPCPEGACTLDWPQHWLDGDHTTHPFVVVEHRPDEPHSIRRWLPARKVVSLLGAYRTQEEARSALLKEAHKWLAKNHRELHYAHLERTFEARTFQLTFDPKGLNFPQEVTNG